MAPDYDKSYNYQYVPIANFIQRLVTIHPDDQLLDIGGGTAEISLLIRKEQNLKKPVVCVDPSQDMLDIASTKEGVIGVCATIEEFLSSRPEYCLDVILMANCVHHFKDVRGIFTNLATFMPSKGTCVITVCDPRTLPYFKAAKEKYIGLEGDKLEELRDALETNGFKLEMATDICPIEMDKFLWYNLLRDRHDSGLWRFTDEELERGIAELEMEYESVNTLKFDYVTKGFIITRK